MRIRIRAAEWTALRRWCPLLGPSHQKACVSAVNSDAEHVEPELGSNDLLHGG